MMTVAGSSHGPKKLDPNNSYGQFRAKKWSNYGQKKVILTKNWVEFIFFNFFDFSS